MEPCTENTLPASRIITFTGRRNPLSASIHKRGTDRNGECRSGDLRIPEMNHAAM